MSTDPDVRRLRERLTENDVAIVAAVNARLALVAELKRVKQERGLDFVDPQREQWLRAHLAETNTGPLSPAALDELVAFLLDVTKREVYREDAASPRL